MKIKRILQKIHYEVTKKMSESWLVENVLIAKVKEDGEEYDCIYCTILRNMVLFISIGFILGLIFGLML